MPPERVLERPVAPPRLAPGRPWGRYVVSVVIAGLVAVLFAVDPATHRLLPACPLLEHTGLYCPGCGGTRAAHRLLHGDLAGAWRMNPLIFVALPLLGLALWKPNWLGRSPVWTWVLLGGLVAFGVARNLPWWPFSLLAPH